MIPETQNLGYGSTNSVTLGDAIMRFFLVMVGEILIIFVSSYVIYIVMYILLFIGRLLPIVSRFFTEKKTDGIQIADSFLSPSYPLSSPISPISKMKSSINPVDLLNNFMEIGNVMMKEISKDKQEPRYMASMEDMINGEGISKQEEDEIKRETEQETVQRVLREINDEYDEE